MDSHPGTLTPPTSMGWYIFWGTGPQGWHPPALYFCVEATSGEVQCMSARPAENDDFLPICHASFAGARWHGPFRSRAEATMALGTVAK